MKIKVHHDISSSNAFTEFPLILAGARHTFWKEAFSCMEKQEAEPVHMAILNAYFHYTAQQLKTL